MRREKGRRDHTRRLHFRLNGLLPGASFHRNRYNQKSNPDDKHGWLPGQSRISYKWKNTQKQIGDDILQPWLYDRIRRTHYSHQKNVQHWGCVMHRKLNSSRHTLPKKYDLFCYLRGTNNRIFCSRGTYRDKDHPAGKSVFRCSLLFLLSGPNDARQRVFLHKGYKSRRIRCRTRGYTLS